MLFLEYLPGVGLHLNSPNISTVLLVHRTKSIVERQNVNTHIQNVNTHIQNVNTHIQNVKTPHDKNCYQGVKCNVFPPSRPCHNEVGVMCSHILGHNIMTWGVK